MTSEQFWTWVALGVVFIVGFFTGSYLQERACIWQRRRRRPYRKNNDY